MGKVIIIGAGPGAADLITVRGARLLRSADVVLFDALTDPALREHAPHAKWIHVGKRGF
jgi:uroporphyrin-III C-methyltransferase